MERLCRTYWYPLYAFVRRKGHDHHDASDLTQAFFARFLEKRYLRSVDANRGKFRTFLLTSLTHFLANEWDKAQAQRRGGGRQIFSLEEESADGRYQLEPADDASPEKLFDRRWAQTLMEVVAQPPGGGDGREAVRGLERIPVGGKRLCLLRRRFGAVGNDGSRHHFGHPSDARALSCAAVRRDRPDCSGAR